MTFVIKKASKMASHRGPGVAVLKPGGQELTFIRGAFGPVWSRNGEYLAYQMDAVGDLATLYVAEKGGDGQRCLGVQSRGAPVWDVDHECLIYSRGTRIYKVNVATCKETQLLECETVPEWYLWREK